MAGLLAETFAKRDPPAVAVGLTFETRDSSNGCAGRITSTDSMAARFLRRSRDMAVPY